MHDFQHSTAERLPELIRELQAGGSKVVHMVPRDPLTKRCSYPCAIALRPVPIETRQGVA
jgi:peptidoglycan-N-acetylglucosamine deacetylase